MTPAPALPCQWSLSHHSALGCLQCASNAGAQARGGIPLVAISVRACMPGQRIFTSKMGVLVPTYTCFFMSRFWFPGWRKPVRESKWPTLKVAEILIPPNVELSEFCLSRRAATRRHPTGVRTRVRTPCSTPFALHLGAIRGRMPRRHVSAQRLIACVPRRNQPQTRLRARILTS